MGAGRGGQATQRPRNTGWRGSAGRRVILAAPLVPAQPLLDAQRRLISAGIGISREGVHFEHHPGIKVDDALRAKTEPILADRDVARVPAIEIFGCSFRNARADALTQCLTEIDVLARHAKRHADLRKEHSRLTASRAFAAPTKESASTHDISPPSG